MCKKIAQLTKVIFELNTRNDERDMAKNFMQNHYEKEIEAVVSEANSRLFKLRDNLERFQDNELKHRLENTLMEIEGDKNMSKNQFESMRNTFERREQDLIDQYESRIEGLNSKIEDLKHQIHTAIDQASDSGATGGGFTTDDINTIKKTIRMEFEARIDTMTQNQKDERNQFEQELKRMDEINIDLKKTEMLHLDEINRLKKSLDESMNSTKSSEQKLMDRIKELNDQLVNKDQTNLKLTNDMNVLQKNLSE
jgi:chromosome segregation ATPase